MSHQRDTPEMDEPTLGFVGFPSTTKSIIVPIIVSTTEISQHTGLLPNYRSLANIVGLHRSLVDLIQFGRLDLHSPLVPLLHTIKQTSIPASWVLLQPNDLNQHNTSQISTSPSSSRK